MLKSVYRHRIYVLFGLAVLVRFLLWALNPELNMLAPDVAMYGENAASLLKTGFIKNPLIMPLLPVYIAVFGNLAGQMGFILLSALSCALVYGITQKLFDDERAALLAMVVMVFYPYYIAYSSILLTENLFFFLFILSVYLLVHGRQYPAFIAATAAVLTRPTPEPLYPVLVFFISYFIHKHELKKSLLWVVKYLAVYAVLMSPWWIHNYAVHGRFVRLNTNGAYLLYLGNVNLKGQGLFPPSEGENFSTPAEVAGMSDAEANKYYVSKTKRYLHEEPLSFVKYFFIKVFRYWKPLPYPDNYGTRSLYFFACLFGFDLLVLAAIAGFIQRYRARRYAVWLLGMIVAYFTFVHGVTFGSVRYRHPIDFIVIIGAALCAARWSEKFNLFEEK